MMKFTPLVSIVVPVYNVENYIERCLASIRDQDYHNIEVIIVDDRGSDNSIPIARRFIESTADERFRIYTNEVNKGLSGARNSGLREAKGEYVYFLDSDDYITPDCISRLVAPLSSRKYDVVIGNYSKETTARTVIAPFGCGEGPVEGNEAILRGYRLGHWYVMAWNKLCNRDFLLYNRLWFEEGLLHEDVLWSFQVFSLARSIYLVDAPTYHYIIRDQSIMTGMSIEKDVRIYLHVFKKINEFVYSRLNGIKPDAYELIEGKKSGILYSLLAKGCGDLYDRYYPDFHSLKIISPLKAWRRKLIGVKYMARDFNYLLPQPIGRVYKRLFFNVVYKWRGKEIQGKVWD